MNYTKQQLETMQDAGVPIQLDVSVSGRGDWETVGNCVFGNPPEHYRPQPGFTFSGTIPRKLIDAGIHLERRVGGVWCPAYPELSADCVMTYRIAEPAAQPVDVIAQLTEDRDFWKRDAATEKARADKFESAFELVCQERDTALKERDEALNRMAKLKAGAAMMQEALS